MYVTLVTEIEFEWLQDTIVIPVDTEVWVDFERNLGVFDIYNFHIDRCEYHIDV